MKGTDRKYVELDLASIVSATENLRDTVRQLSEKGWMVFEATKDHPSLISLVLSADATQQGQYVALIEAHEPTIKELADNMATTGQLEPIRVRPAEKKGEFDLVFGARRMLARLYIHAKSAGKIPARLTAEITEQDGKEALYASISENIREAPSPLDEARSYERLRKSFGMNAKEIGSATGRSEKVIRLRLKLLKLPKELQEKVHLGKIGVERALKHLEDGDWWLAVNGASVAACPFPAPKEKIACRPTPEQLIGLPTQEEQEEARRFLLRAETPAIKRRMQEWVPRIRTGEMAYIRPAKPDPPTTGPTAWVC